MFIKKSVEKKSINFYQTLGFRIIFKLVRKVNVWTNLYVFCNYLGFFVRYNQSLRGKINLILFCIFNFVTFLNSYPLNSFISKFWSFRRKNSDQYHFNKQLKGEKWKKCVRLVIKTCERIFRVEELSSLQKSSYVKS